MYFEISVCIDAFLRIFVKKLKNGYLSKNTLWPSLGRFGTTNRRNYQRINRQIEKLRKERQEVESLCNGILAHPVGVRFGVVF